MNRRDEMELAPCPFCGGSDLAARQDLSEDDGRAYAFHIFCCDCHARGRNHYRIGWCETEKASIEAWNDRLAQPKPGYVVKPLEWSQKPPPGHDHEPFVYWASGIGGHYKADRDGTLWMAHDAFVWEPYETQKEAKAAAQADHEHRIRSAITTAGTAEPGYVAGFEVAWHKARNAWMKASRHETQQKADEAAVQVLIAALPAPATASAGEEVTVESIAYHVRLAVVEHAPGLNSLKREVLGDTAAASISRAFHITKRSAT